VVLLSFGFVFTLNASIFSQSTSNDERPTLKNFGSSLREFDKKNKDKNSGTKEQKEQNDKTSEEETISIKTNLVTSDVLVLDQKGNAILGLKQSDFVVIDNGVQQEIGIFSYGENVAVPRSIVLIIDYSGSMEPYLDRSIKAASNLVDKLGQQDRMAIVTDDVKLLVGFTKDKNLLKKKLKSLFTEAQRSEAKAGWFSGHSLQYSALLATLQELFDEEDILPIIIFQTDGDELLLLKPTMSREYKSVERKFSFNDVLEKLEKSRATIYSIIPGVRLMGLSAQEYKRKSEIFLKQYPSGIFSEKMIAFVADKQTALSEVAKLSGGYTNFLEKSEDAERVYSTIFGAINKRYLIGYYPTTPSDGKRHYLKIQVRGHPEYQIAGRKTYFPQ
jgi:VWFA-related protein